MKKYYVNKNAQSNGDHEVHTQNCIYYPSDNLYLGCFSHCSAAVIESKKTYTQSNGCKTCSTICHTS